MMNRVAHIDIAKGIGILAVVLGHNWFVIGHKGELYNIIFSFHMPLFFFLSGLFLRTDKRLKVFALERADSLLKPYFVILFSVSFIYIVFKGASPTGYYAGILYGNGSTIAWSPLWFLTHLWAVCLFAYFIAKLVRLEAIQLYGKLVLFIILLIFGYLTVGSLYKIPVSFGGNIQEIFGKSGLLPGLPFSIDVIFLSTFFFLLGYVLKKEVFLFSVRFSYFAVSVAVFLLLHLVFDYTIDFNLRIYGDILVSTIQAVLGIYIVLSVSYLIAPFSGLSTTLAKIGSASIFILIFHRFFQDNTFNILNKLFKDMFYVNGVLAFFGGFLGPMVIWYMTKSNNYLALLLLPLKNNKLLLRQRQSEITRASGG